MNRSPKIDEYISNSAEFAQPILMQIRALVHQAHPDIEESIKWGKPSFEYKGIVCHMAAFKTHCSFGFMKYKLIKGVEKTGGMNSFGKLRSVENLPKEDVMLMFIKEAIHLNEIGVQLPKNIKKKKDLILPEAISKALNNNLKANRVFNDFAYTYKKEYIEWIAEAKRGTTREKRIIQMLEWLEERKHRNWKYEKC